MAIGKKSFLFQEVEGQIGGVIATTDRAGRTVLRAKPETVSNPQTVSQVNQRNKFAKINQIAGVAPNLISRGWRDTATNNPLHTARNRFMSYNLKNVFDGETVDTLNATKVVFGEGSLSAPNVAINAQGFDPADQDMYQLDITPSALLIGADDQGDRFMIGLVNIDTGESTIKFSFTRGHGQRTVDLDAVSAGEYYIVCGYVTNEEFLASNNNPLVVLGDADSKLAQSGIVTIGSFVK